MTAHNQINDFPFSLERPQSPAEANAFCEALGETMEHLLDLIESETSLVRAGRLKEAGTLQPEKAKLIHAYTRGMLCAKQHAVALGNLAPAAAQNLRRRHGEFQPVLRINLAVLSAARDVATTIVSTVAKAVGGQTSTTTYGPKGQAPTVAKPANGIALNQHL
ncbi:hypothetical protein [Roseibium aestuarii]|uniref:Flagellar protein FlgN n=1 Tax=Roseibium aestuarii TaxID=2600299 RepID=A0ABW4JYS4_9HYPH|nr:hypothetical protein [Roseibium aestuarii]